MNRPTCETCVYWSEYQIKSAKEGGCYRRSPVAFGPNSTGMDEVTANWAITEPHYWCGEHSDFDEWIENQRVNKDPNIKGEPK